MVTGISGKSLGGERLRLRLGLSWAREVRQATAGQRRGTDKILSGSLGVLMAHAPRGKEGQPVRPTGKRRWGCQSGWEGSGMQGLGRIQGGLKAGDGEGSAGGAKLGLDKATDWSPGDKGQAPLPVGDAVVVAQSLSRVQLCNLTA